MPEAAAPAAPSTAIAEYSPTAAGLAVLRHRLAGVVYDLTTTAGQEQARKDRRECVSLRTALEAKRVELKAPALERSRLIDAEAKALAAEILALEGPIDAAIKADEQRRAAEKEAREQAERGRVAGIRAKIDAIKARATTAYKLPSAEVAALIEATPPIDASAFAEFAVEAESVRTATIEYLTELRDTKAAQEAEAAKLAAEREELARLRTAEEERQAAARAQEQRLAAEAQVRRDAEEAEARRQREEADRQAAAERAEQDRIAREAREREEQEARERRQREDAERERVERIRYQIDDIRALAHADYRDSAEILSAIERLNGVDVTEPRFAEFTEEALVARKMVVGLLDQRLAARIQVEQEQAEAREAQERAERQRQEDEARAVAARDEDVQREAKEARRAALIALRMTDMQVALASILDVARDQAYSDSDARARIDLIAEANLEPPKPAPERKPRRRLPQQAEQVSA